MHPCITKNSKTTEDHSSSRFARVKLKVNLKSKSQWANKIAPFIDWFLLHTKPQEWIVQNVDAYDTCRGTYSQFACKWKWKRLQNNSELWKTIPVWTSTFQFLLGLDNSCLLYSGQASNIPVVLFQVFMKSLVNLWRSARRTNSGFDQSNCFRLTKLDIFEDNCHFQTATSTDCACLETLSGLLGNLTSPYGVPCFGIPHHNTGLKTRVIGRILDCWMRVQ